MNDLGINSVSYTEFNDFLKIYGIPRTDAEDGELALTKADTVKALNLLADTEVGILGGDVYELENDGYFRPTYDNWYCNKEDSSSIEFSEKSREKALTYLSNYNEAKGLKIRYVLVVDS